MCAERAWERGVTPKRVEEKETPLGLSFVTVGMIVGMMVLRGSPSPRVPLEFVNDSNLTVVAAATNRQTKVNMASNRR